MINVIHAAKPFLYTQIVSWVLLRQHIIASTFFFLCIIWQYGNLIVSTEVVQCQFKYKE